MDLSPDQLRVHDAVLDWLKNPGAPHWRAYAMLTDPSATELRIMTVGGNGGTGKTTVLGRLARSFPTPTAYVAPTGRAASKLTNSLIAGGMRITKLQRPPEGKKLSRKWRHLFDDSLPENGGPPLCTTIHGLLLRPVIDNKTEELLGWQTRDKLDRKYRLIVVDEASMIGDKMLLTLKARGVLVLAVGDHWQLPPVKDSGSLMANPILRLETIHRQAEGSPIIALSQHIGRGGRLRDFTGWNADCVLRPKSDEEAVVRETLGLDRPPGTPPPNPLDVTFIAWTNKTRVRLNRIARRLQGYEGPPVVGEPIVALHNYGVVCNGMRGILAQPSFMNERHDWILHANVEFPDDGMAGDWHEMCGHQFNREHPFASVAEMRAAPYGMPVETMSAGGELFDWGYCLTGHKSQGSQFDHVVVIYERDRTDEESRRWNYTATSRAIRRISILA